MRAGSSESALENSVHQLPRQRLLGDLSELDRNWQTRCVIDCQSGPRETIPYCTSRREEHGLHAVKGVTYASEECATEQVDVLVVHGVNHVLLVLQHGGDRCAKAYSSY